MGFGLLVITFMLELAPLFAAALTGHWLASKDWEAIDIAFAVVVILAAGFLVNLLWTAITGMSFIYLFFHIFIDYNFG